MRRTTVTSHVRAVGATLVFSGVCLVGPVRAPAAPRGEQVVAGSATFSHEGAKTVIEAANNTIINYQAFDILRHETVQFVQPAADARVLNRVTELNPSQIDGALLSNGIVYLINPAGVYFGEGALVNVGGLYAAAGSISDQSFLSGTDLFTNLSGAVTNAGTIEGGLVNLVGRHVANHGTIFSDAGVVTLAAGDSVYIGKAEGHVLVQIAGLSAKEAAEGGGDSAAGVQNSGTIDAGRGTVTLAAGDMYSLAVRHDGATRANRIVIDGGHGPGAGKVEISGTLDASDRSGRGVGGSVRVFGEDVALLGARVDACGDAGGGSASIGGDFQGKGPAQNSSRTYISSDSVVRADAVSNGDGGRVIVWSDGLTGFGGSISARGGADGGDGGFAEVSGKAGLVFRGHTDLAAPRGEGGTLLLDPRIIIVDKQGGFPLLSNDEFDENPDDTSTIAADEVASLLFDGIDVELQANFQLQVLAAVVVGPSSVPSGDLTLRSGGVVDIPAPIDFFGSFTAISNDPKALATSGTPQFNILLRDEGRVVTHGGDVSLIISPDGGGSGTIFLNPGAIDAGGGNVTLSAELGSIVVDDNNPNPTVEVATTGQLSVAVQAISGFFTNSSLDYSGASSLSVTDTGPGLITVRELVAHTVQSTSVTVNGKGFGTIDLFDQSSTLKVVSIADDAVIAQVDLDHDFSLTAVSSITQTGPVSVAGSSSFMATGAGAAVVLDGSGNSFGGPVSLQAEGSAAVVNLGQLLLAGNVGGNLSATSGGADVVDGGPLSVGGSSSFTATGGFARSVVLDELSAVGPVTLLAAGNSVVINAVALSLQGSVLGSLEAEALTGALTTSGPLAVSTGLPLIGGQSSFRANGPGGQMVLDQLSSEGPVLLDTVGDATVVNDVALVLTGHVGGDLTAQALTGRITDEAPLVVSGEAAFTADGAGGAVTVDDLAVGGTLALSTVGDALVVNQGNLSLNGTVGGTLTAEAVSGAITDAGAIQVGGAATFTTLDDTGAGITLDDAGSAYGPLSVMSLDSTGSLPSPGALRVVKSTPLEIAQASTAGTAEFTAPGISLTGLVSADTVVFDVTTGGFTEAPGGRVQSGAGGTTIRSENLLLTGPYVGTGNLILQTSTPTGSITIGAGSPVLFEEGFTSITIGRPDGQHAVSIGAVTFNDPVTIQSPNGGSIAVNDTITGLDNASVALRGSFATTTLHADIVTSGTPIVIDDNVLLGDVATVRLDTTFDEADGADVTVTGAIDDTGAASSLVVAAGALGRIGLQGDVGGTTPVAAVDFSAANMTLPQVVTAGQQRYTVGQGGRITLGSLHRTLSAGTIEFSGDVLLAGDTQVQAFNGGIVFDGAADGGSNLGLDAGIDAVTFNAPVGATTPLGGMTIRADGLTINAPITLAAGGAVTIEPSTARPVDLGSDTPGALGLSAAELARITAPGGLFIGDGGPAAQVTISQPVVFDPSQVGLLVLRPSGAVDTQVSGSLTVRALAVDAGGAVGLVGDVDQLAVRSGGGISVSDSGDLTVTDVAGVSGLSTTSAGSPVVVASQSVSVDSEVNSSGGDVTIAAEGGDLAVNADVASSGGRIDLAAENNLLLASEVNSAGGDVALAAASGGATLGGPVNAGGGAIDIVSGQAIEGSGLLTAGAVSLIAQSGIGQASTPLLLAATAITANNAGAGDVALQNSLAGGTTAGLLATRGGNIGFTQDLGALTLSGSVTSGDAAGGVPGGDIHVKALGGLVVQSGVTLDTQAGTGGQSNLSGAIAFGGTLIPGAGDITLEGAQNPDTDLTITSDQILSAPLSIFATGNVDIRAALQTVGSFDVLVTADSDGQGGGGVRIAPEGRIDSGRDVIITGTALTLAGTGGQSVLIEADGAAEKQITAIGSVTIQSSGFAPSTAGIVVSGSVAAGTGIAVDSSGDATLGGAMTSGGGVLAVRSDAGAINGAGLLTAPQVDLEAATGIGSTTPLQLASASIAADTAAGDVHINNASTGTVTVTSLTTGGSNITFTQSDGGSASFAKVRGVDGDVTLVNTAGDLTIPDQGQDDGVVTTHGNIKLQAHDLSVLASIDAGTGTVSFVPNVGQTVGVGTTSQAFNVEQAEIDQVTAAATAIEIGSLDSGDMRIGLVDVTGRGSGFTLILSSGGSVQEEVPSAEPHVLTAGPLIIQAGGQVGSAECEDEGLCIPLAGDPGPLDVSAPVVEVHVLEPGKLFLVDAVGVELRNVDTVGGDIFVRSPSFIRARDVEAHSDITLISGSGGIGLGTVTAESPGQVTVNASTGTITNINESLAVINVQADAASFSGSSIGTAAAPVTTRVSDLTTNTTGDDGDPSNDGDQFLTQFGSLQAVNMQAGEGAIQLTVINGGITDADPEVDISSSKNVVTTPALDPQVQIDPPPVLRSNDAATPKGVARSSTGAKAAGTARAAALPLLPAGKPKWLVGKFSEVPGWLDKQPQLAQLGMDWGRRLATYIEQGLESRMAARVVSADRKLTVDETQRLVLQGVRYACEGVIESLEVKSLQVTTTGGRTVAELAVLVKLRKSVGGDLKVLHVDTLTLQKEVAGQVTAQDLDDMLKGMAANIITQVEQVLPPDIMGSRG